MNWWHDQIDWLGGYPYETAGLEEVLDFFKERGFHLQKMTTCGGDWVQPVRFFESRLSLL